MGREQCPEADQQNVVDQKTAQDIWRSKKSEVSQEDYLKFQKKLYRQWTKMSWSIVVKGTTQRGALYIQNSENQEELNGMLFLTASRFTGSKLLEPTWSVIWQTIIFSKSLCYIR